MPTEQLEVLRYPNGRFSRRQPLPTIERTTLIRRMAHLPAELRGVLSGLDDAELDTPYRPDGWTVRQVVHHVADSHVNAYVRTRLALTEPTPSVQGYDQDAWARLADAREAPVEPSLDLLDALHARWVELWESLDEEEFGRQLRHGELGLIDLSYLVQLYAWHGGHHVAQISALRERAEW